MTVDVEDYFQVSAFDDVVARAQWGSFESRVCRNTERLLSLFEETNVRGTFFVLGWVAERYPSLVKRIAAAGHEVASHGFMHRLVYDSTPEQFRSDVQRTKGLLESITGRLVAGYRAPSYSITDRSLWALDVLIEEGYRYDASIYPIHHDRYGIPSAPRFVHQVFRQSGSIWEVPGSTVRYGRVNFPIGGGGYFRMLPYGWTRSGIRRLNTVEGRPAIFYVHPWEIDPGQPRLSGSMLSRLRHYRNLDLTENRLRLLVQQFAFGSIMDILPGSTCVESADQFESSLATATATATATAATLGA